MTQPVATSPIPSQELIDDFVRNAHGNLPRVEELLQQYPDLLNRSATWGELPLEAASHVGNEETAVFLLAAGAPTTICTEAMLGHTERVKAYLDADIAKAKATGAHGISVLYHAIIHGHDDIGELLLSNGANIDSGEGGSPALHGAVMFNRLDMVRWLLARSANINIKNHQGKTPLKAAIDNNRPEIADFLRSHGGVE
jgi:uncharacterized protein